MNGDLRPLPTEPRPGRYRHYKGNLYEVIGLARHSETLEPLVVYRPLYGDVFKLWVRPHSMWNETVDVEGRKVPRFARSGDWGHSEATGGAGARLFLTKALAGGIFSLTNEAW